MSCFESEALLAEKPETAVADKETTDCVKLSKVYDWVILKSDQSVQADIPTADLAAVLAAIAAGHTLTVTVTLDLVNSTVQVVSISRINDQKACVTFRKLLISTIVIYDQTTSTTLSTFGKTVQLFDSSDICFPVGLPTSAISVTIRNGVGDALSVIPFDGQLTIAYTLCQEITVTLDIFAKVKILSYCESRLGAPCRSSIACAAGAVTYPDSCSGIPGFSN